jgi:hypothetical protein
MGGAGSPRPGLGSKSRDGFKPRAALRNKEMPVLLRGGIFKRKFAATALQPARRLRVMIRPSTHGAAGRAVGYGLKFGYWPCLRGPFVQIAIHRWVVEVWWGLPSYRYGGGSALAAHLRLRARRDLWWSSIENHPRSRIAGALGRARGIRSGLPDIRAVPARQRRAKL